MLQESLFESASRNKKRHPVTVVVSVIAHVVTIGVLIMLPLLQTQALPIPPVDVSLFFPRTAPTTPVTVFSSQPRRAAAAHTDSSVPPILTSPRTIPSQIAPVDDPGRIAVDLPPSGTGTFISTGPGSGPGPINLAPPNIEPPAAPPAPPPPPAVKAKPIRQGGGVQEARLVYQVKPVYPPLARQTRVQGVVVLEAVINKGGSIDSLRVISGHPLLTQAALDAVRQWKYRPTLLNSDPVDVVTTVTVTFTLQ